MSWLSLSYWLSWVGALRERSYKGVLHIVSPGPHLGCLGCGAGFRIWPPRLRLHPHCLVHSQLAHSTFQGEVRQQNVMKVVRKGPRLTTLCRSLCPKPTRGGRHQAQIYSVLSVS